MAKRRVPKQDDDSKKRSEIETYYWTDVTYVCPVRGKITEKVKVKKLKPQESPKIIPNYELEILKDEVDDAD